MSTKTKILIIDDSYTNRICFKAILEELDIEVLEAHSAAKALELLDKTTPDVILLDMCMPMMNGIEFLKCLQMQKRNIPVIVASILDDHAQIQIAFRHGASDYLIKPIETDKLVTHIAKYTQCEV